MNFHGEKIILLAIGLFVAVITFVFAAYFSSFVTKADYNKDQAAISAIQSDIACLKRGQSEIKELIKELR